MKLFTSRNHHISQKTCWGIHTETRTKLRLWVALDALKRSDQTIKALWTPRATETFQYCRSAHFRPLPPTNQSYAQINHSYFIQPYLTLHRKWKLYHSSAMCEFTGQLYHGYKVCSGMCCTPAAYQ